MQSQWTCIRVALIALLQFQRIQQNPYPVALNRWTLLLTGYALPRDYITRVSLLRVLNH